MNKIIIMALSCLIWISCSQNEIELYDAKPAVYFEDLSNEADSISYSFTTTTELSDTININVKLLGNLIEDKHFTININDSSTAVAGVHYEPLQETYLYKAGRSSVSFPIIVKYSSDLDESIVTLSFSIESNEELDAGYSDQLSGRLLITNQLVKPSYWNNPLSLYFGEYSKVKHQICTDIMGHDFPFTLKEAQYWGGGTIYGYWMRAGREVAAYIASHEVYDENGDLISDWIPF